MLGLRVITAVPSLLIVLCQFSQKLRQYSYLFIEKLVRFLIKVQWFLH